MFEFTYKPDNNQYGVYKKSGVENIMMGVSY